MAVTIYCVHTILNLEETFNSLINELVPGETQVHHISDESLIRRVLAAGGMTKGVRKRFFQNVVAAEEAGADIAQVTCSSVTPAIPCVREMVDIPVFSIDEPMARETVGRYSKVGVMATNPGTLNPSSELLRKTADSLGKEITVSSVLCDGAYDALLGGDRQRHDKIVKDYFRRLNREVDAVVLAQASMAPIIDSLDPEERQTPVLTSPRKAVEALADYVRGRGEV